jgi:GNAT superfamily N-acetyltransferase
MTSQHQAKLITAEQTLFLRHQVLKPHLSREECVLPGDSEGSTFHIGVLFFGRLVSVSTYMLQSHSDFSAGFPFRLRGMATDRKYQGQGLGALGLHEGINRLKEIHCDFLWFNARIKAFGFYEKLGFKPHGPLFEIEGIGHKVMYKHLFPR